MDEPDDWNAGGIINPNPVDASQIPQYVSLAGLALLECHAVAAPDVILRQRMSRVRQKRAESIAEAMREVEDQDELSTDPGEIAPQISGRLPEGVCLALLISAVTENPFEPYHIKVSSDARKAANREFARDLGVPASWADQAWISSKWAKKKLNATWSPGGLVTATLGLAAVVAALPLAVAFAPVGLAGGALFLSSLATLGGGFGLMGGIAVISSVAALGGGATMAGVRMLVSGSSQQVHQRLATLAALASAKMALRPGTPVSEPELIRLMKQELEEELSDRDGIDDKGSASMKEAKTKLENVERALKVIAKLQKT